MLWHVFRARNDITNELTTLQVRKERHLLLLLAFLACNQKITEQWVIVCVRTHKNNTHTGRDCTTLSAILTEQYNTGLQTQSKLWISNMKLQLKGIFLVMYKVMNSEYPNSQVQQNAPLDSTTNCRVNSTLQPLANVLAGLLLSKASFTHKG